MDHELKKSLNQCPVQIFVLKQSLKMNPFHLKSYRNHKLVEQIRVYLLDQFHSHINYHLENKTQNNLFLFRLFFYQDLA